MTLSSFYFGPIATVAFGIDRVEKLAGDVNGLVGEGAPVLLIGDPGIAALGDRTDDLVDAILVLKPRVVIPMHYQLPSASFKMLPVTDFTSRFPAAEHTYSAPRRAKNAAAN